MKQGHADALGTFCIAVHFVGSSIRSEVIMVLLFLEFSCRGGFDPRHNNHCEIHLPFYRAS